MSVILITLMSLFVIFGGSPQEDVQSILSERTFILVLNLSVLNCPLCAQSLTEFIGMVNAFKLEKTVLGVLVFSQKENGSVSEKKVKIAEKQLRGFIIGNDIQFPFFLDRSGIFEAINPDATATLILFDRNESVVKKYTFPLTRAQMQEIYRD